MRAAPFRRKSLGQHHLKSGRTCRPLIAFLGLEPGAKVLEIGPGGGILTRELLATGAQVVAVELDPAWAFELPKRVEISSDREAAVVASSSRLIVLVGDALEISWERLGPECRVAGNLPYNVGTVIVERMLAAVPPGTRAAFLLQREVVDRIVARPGDEAYGALSVLVAARARAVLLGVVKPGAFVPPPKVESAFVGFEAVAPPLPVGEMAGLERVIKAAFGQRRKSLRNALATAFGRERAEAGLNAAAIEPRRRAEELDLDDFVRLAASLARAAAAAAS